jgi:hypothetical protein
MIVPTFFAEARKSFHAALFDAVLRIDTAGVASNAEKVMRIVSAWHVGLSDDWAQKPKGHVWRVRWQAVALKKFVGNSWRIVT